MKKKKNCILAAIVMFMMLFTFAINVQADEESENITQYLTDIEYDDIFFTSHGAEMAYGCVMVMKKASGFDMNDTLYGIYNYEEKEWIMEYTTLPGIMAGVNASYTDNGCLRFDNYAIYSNGVISYSCYNENGEDTGGFCYVSPYADHYLIIDDPYVCTTFWVGQNLLCITEDGSLKLKILYEDLELVDLKAKGFAEKEIEGYFLDSSQDYGEYTFSYMLINDVGNKKLLIYDPVKERVTFINDEGILSRMTEGSIVAGGQYDDELPPGYYLIDLMMGDDGQEYSVLFDADGNEVVSPFLSSYYVRNQYDGYAQDVSGVDDELVGTWYFTGGDEGVSAMDVTFDENHSVSTTEYNSNGYVVDDGMQTATYSADAEKHLLYMDEDASYELYFVLGEKLLYRGYEFAK